MSVEQVMARAKRAREAYRRMVQDLEARGETTIARKAQDAMDAIKVEGLVSSDFDSTPSEKEVISRYGGVLIAKEDLPDYGIDPAVLYLMNDQQGFDSPGDFYGFPDGSMVLIEQNA